jgi:predicted kinase
MSDDGDFVLDDTNCFRWLRDRFRAVADAHGYRTVVVHLDIPPEILRERMAQNEATRERSAIRPSVFDAVAATFEGPAEDEITLRFTPNDHMDAWLDRHLPRSADRVE